MKQTRKERQTQYIHNGKGGIYNSHIHTNTDILYLELLGGEGGQAGAHGVPHGLGVLALGHGVQEPPVPEVCSTVKKRKRAVSCSE